MLFWKTLTTNNPRCELREETVDQADIIYDAIQQNFDYLSKWVGWVTKEYSRQDNYDAIKDNQYASQQGKSYVACVYYEGEFAGCVDTRINDKGAWEAGYWIVEKFSGLGLASLCTSALLDHVHAARGIASFELYAAVDNVKSQRVAEKIGFRRTGEVTSDRREYRYVKEYRDST